jgi:signal peptidase I
MIKKVTFVSPIILAVWTVFPVQPLPGTEYQKMSWKNLALLDRVWPERVGRYAYGDFVVFMWVETSGLEAFDDFRNPFRPEERGYGRILGKPGDIVTPKNMKPFAKEIPTGHCWIEWDYWTVPDNSLKSLDSNDFGPVIVPIPFRIHA